MVLLPSVVCFLLLQSRIPVYGYAKICLFIHQSVNIYIVSNSDILWIKMLWTFIYKPEGKIIFLFLLGVELLNYIVNVCLTLFKKKNYQSVFQCCLIILHFHQHRVRFPISSQTHQHLTIVGLFNFHRFIMVSYY